MRKIEPWITPPCVGDACVAVDAAFTKLTLARGEYASSALRIAVRIRNLGILAINMSTLKSFHGGRTGPELQSEKSRYGTLKTLSANDTILYVR